MNNLIKEYLQLYLQQVISGERKLSPEVISRFGEECSSAIEKQFNRNAKPEKWRPRMSGLGKPLCQQQLERDGVKVEKKMEYNSINRFLFGDLLESLLVMEMEQAGINVEAKQKPVSLEIAGTTINGTLDVIIDGAVWDVKTASPYAFTNKFANYGKVKNDDPFGYVVQGFLYGAAENKPFGGWIVINKSSGEVNVCPAPSIQDEERTAALAVAEHNMTVLNDPSVKLQKLEDEPEKIRRNTTGNRLLKTTCAFCDFKEHCWPKAQLKEKFGSNRAYPPMAWYSKYVTEDGDASNYS